MTTNNEFINPPAWFAGWEQDVLTGNGPELWSCGRGFEDVEIGPGTVTLVGGPPGGGKTAISMQLTVDALRLDPSLRVLVANVEMSVRALMDRQLSRLSGLDATSIRFRRFDVQEPRIRAALDELRGIADRLEFYTGPPSMRSVAERANEFQARLVVLDYVQRFTVGNGEPQDKRAELDSLIAVVRRLAESGFGMLVVSAVARQTGKTGSNYNGLGLASFRGSSELEYGTDSAWILTGDDDDRVFECVKNRNGQTPTLELYFNRARQTFTVKPNPADEIAAYFGQERHCSPREPQPSAPQRKGGKPDGTRFN